VRERERKREREREREVKIKRHPFVASCKKLTAMAIAI